MIQLQEKKLNTIIIITTEGCIGCQIMIDIVTNAINESNKDIELIVSSHEFISKEFLKNNNIKDFPSTVFVSNNEIKGILVGTVNSSVVKDKINKYFCIN